MDPIELLKEGRLFEARKQAVEEVKAFPGDLGRRMLLFQVLSFCGEWDKVERHLDVVPAQEPTKQLVMHVYKDVLIAEKERAQVAGLRRRPTFLPEAPAYAETYLTARQALMDHKIEEAARLFEDVEKQRPVLVGTVNQKSFEGFRDTDACLSFFLEAIVFNQYVWVPLEAVRELTVAPPRSFLDLLWIPANLTTWSGLNVGCCLPVLYADSCKSEDERVRLGRMTDWTPLGGPFSRGVGQHVFEVGDEEMALLDIREAVFKTPQAADGAYEEEN